MKQALLVLSNRKKSRPLFSAEIDIRSFSFTMSEIEIHFDLEAKRHEQNGQQLTLSLLHSLKFEKEKHDIKK